jgi:uncharacterized protein YcbK (DUF882 family)
MRSRFALAAAFAGLALVLGGDQTPAEAETSCLPGALKHTLAQIRSKFGPVQVISTRRPGARTPNGKPSYHASCRAVDFNAPSGKYAAVVAWLKANHNGGLGTYSCGMHHIHIDNGPNYRWHTCGGG